MHKKKAGKLQTGSIIPKQYWLAVNGKPKTVLFPHQLFYYNLKDGCIYLKPKSSFYIYTTEGESLISNNFCTITVPNKIF